MGKFLGGLLKMVAIVAALGASVYAVVTYWDKIKEVLDKAKNTVVSVKDGCYTSAEFDDYADWDE